MKWALQKLSTTDGFLQSCPVEFSSGLNCIIGARGTCKSTILETVRFVFDCEPDKVRDMLTEDPSSEPRNPFRRTGLLVETLGGGTAKCTIGMVDDPACSVFAVERNVTMPPRVYRDGVQQVDGTALLHRIEVYSQGDLHSIAEVPRMRLGLIDRPNQQRVAELEASIQTVARELETIGPKIRKRRLDIESSQAKVQTLEPLRHQLTEMQANRPNLSPELESERVAYNTRQQAFERMKAAEQAYARAVSAARAMLSEEISLRESAAFAGELEMPEAEVVAEALSKFADAMMPIRGIAESPARLAETLDILGAAFERENRRYYELRKDQQAANDALKTEEALRQGVLAMEAVEADLAEQNAIHARDLAKRRDLRARRDALADELYALRMEQIEKINAEFGEQIILTLRQGALTSRHKKLIEELLHRSNLRNQSEVAGDLAEKVRPSDLVDIIEASDARRLAEVLGRDLGQMTRMVSHLLDSNRLYELETVMPEDNLEITMIVRGEVRPIEKLSKGQMATALLPLILREAEYPLLVDQPEDDLDNAFISDKLIEKLASLRRRRQLIFVTHNANIPVLGEADRIVVMDMDGPKKALPCQHGSVDAMKDQIIDLLEGGKEAFKSRQEKYGNALR